MRTKLRRYILQYGYDSEDLKLCSPLMDRANFTFASVFTSFFVIMNLIMFVLYPHNNNNEAISVILVLMVAITAIVKAYGKYPKYTIYIFYAELVGLIYINIIRDSHMVLTYNDIALLTSIIISFSFITLGNIIMFSIILLMCVCGFIYISYYFETIAVTGNVVIYSCTIYFICIAMHYLFVRMCLNINISHRKLEVAERQIELALQNSDIFVWEYDIVGKRFIQKLKSEHANYDLKVMEDFPESAIAAGVILPESIADMKNLHDELRNGVKEASAEIGHILKDGETKWSRIKYVTIFDGENKPSRAIGCSSDVTTEVQSRKAREMAERHLTFAMSNNDQIEGYLISTALCNITRGFVIKHDSKHLMYKFAPGASVDSIFDRIEKTIPDEKEKQEWRRIHNLEYLSGKYHIGTGQITLANRRSDKNGRIFWTKEIIRLHRDNSMGDIIAICQLYDIDGIKIKEKILNTIINENYDYIARIMVEDGSFVVYSDLEERDTDNSGHDYCTRTVAYDLSHNIDGDTETKTGTLMQSMIKNLEDNERFEYLYKEKADKGVLKYKKLSYRYLDEDKKYILLTREDITRPMEQEQHKNEELSIALDSAEKANVAKTRFLSNISHDMRTPMNIIMNMADLADSERNDPLAVKEYMEKISTAGKFLLALINDALDVSKIESGSLELRPDVYEFEDFYSAIKTVIEPLCTKNGIKFVIDIEKTGFSVYADITRFNQIFFNLLSNAVKFTPRGGLIEFKASVVETDGDYMVKDYIVRDNGIGMSEEFMNVMFNPFTQESSEIRSDLEGTGLGLSIVKSIVDKMGGTISVKSKKGEGTEFKVRLKMSIVSENMIPSGKKSCVGTECIEGLNILLVEDHPLNAEIVLKILSRFGAKVVRTENGMEAVEEFTNSEQGYFDIILMDIRMPVMDGLEATKAIRALDRTDSRKVPIIAMTANSFESDKKQSIMAGINEHLTKPIDTQKLIKTILRFVKKT